MFIPEDGINSSVMLTTYPTTFLLFGVELGCGFWYFTPFTDFKMLSGQFRDYFSATTK
jgi:hypothetical protein